jgi:hypothetical protein
MPKTICPSCQNKVRLHVGIYQCPKCGHTFKPTTGELESLPLPLPPDETSSFSLPLLLSEPNREQQRNSHRKARTPAPQKARESRRAKTKPAPTPAPRTTEVGISCDVCLRLFQAAPGSKAHCPDCGQVCQAPTQAEVNQELRRQPTWGEEAEKAVMSRVAAREVPPPPSQTPKWPKSEWPEWLTAENVLGAMGVAFVATLALFALVGFVQHMMKSGPTPQQMERARIQREARERLERETDRMLEAVREAQIQVEMERQRRQGR